MKPSEGWGREERFLLHMRNNSELRQIVGSFITEQKYPLKTLFKRRSPGRKLFRSLKKRRQEIPGEDLGYLE